MGNPQQAIDLLVSINAGIQELIRRSGPAASGSGPVLADARDLDSQYGDPQVKFLPRDWHGDNFKGCNFSACTPELRDQLAEAVEYFERKDEESGATTEAGKPKEQ